MTRLTFILTEGFADWEPALLAASARTWYGCRIEWAAPGARPLTSSGGMRVTPDLALEDIAATDALIAVGGPAWRQPGAPDLSDAVALAWEQGAVIAGLCDGTRALAATGILNGVAHSSNDADTLDVAGYAGAARFRASAAAVRDGRIVTAPGTAPVSFMAEVMAALGLADANLGYYRGLLAAEHAAPRASAAA